MSKVWLTTAILAISEVAVIAGDVAAKRWVQGATWGLIAAVICYAVTTGSWLLTLRLIGDLGRASLLWTASGMVAGPIVGLVFFGETLSVVNAAGVVLCFLGAAAVMYR